MKTIPLIQANLKGFIRNWKSVLLLIILPLVLITIIFASFNPEGLRTISIGYSLSDEQTLDEEALQDALQLFALLTRYNSLEECKERVYEYQEYACVHVSGTGPYVLDVHYDNTREPVIWEVIERIKQAVRTVQREESRTIATDFLSSFKAALRRLSAYQSELDNIHRDLDGYVYEVQKTRQDLDQARNQLELTLNEMDRDIMDARAESNEARFEKNQKVQQAENYLSTTENYLEAIPVTEGYETYKQISHSQLDMAQDSVDELDRDMERSLDEIDRKVAGYEIKSAEGRQYVFQLQQESGELMRTRQRLVSYQGRVRNTQLELADIEQEFADLQELDAETLVNPVVIHNIPNYVPEYDLGRSATAEDAVRGYSFISLQTLFPGVLVLITVFLSLLIGAFVTLSEVNEPSHTRIRLAPRTFFPEFFATFLSACLIVAVPVGIVLLLGNWLFKIGIFTHFGNIIILFSLLVFFFVFLGMLLAYAIRKESMTLMASTFLLILIIFLSGFLLPIERMSEYISIAALLNPATIVLDAFKQVVFYDATPQLLVLTVLALQASVLFLAALLLKRLRQD